jgi:ribosomal RNA-processing protein 1
VHRMDKYYMLVRRFVNASFRLLERSEWSTTACGDYNDILSGQEGPLACVLLACNLLIFAED